MICIKGNNGEIAIIGAISEPNFKELVSRSGNPFSVCDVGIASSINPVDGKCIYTTVKCFGERANALAECRKGDWLLVVGTEKKETWQTAHGTQSKVVVEAREFFVLKETTAENYSRQNKGVVKATTGESQPVDLSALNEIDDDECPF